MDYKDNSEARISSYGIINCDISDETSQNDIDLVNHVKNKLNDSSKSKVNTSRANENVKDSEDHETDAYSCDKCSLKFSSMITFERHNA